MSEKFKALTVVLRDDVDEDDAANLVNAISQFRGVISVIPEPVAYEDFVAQERAKHELRRKLVEVLM